MKRKDCTTKISNGSYLIHTRVGNFTARLCGSMASVYAPAGNLMGYFPSMQQAIENLVARGYIIEAQSTNESQRPA